MSTATSNLDSSEYLPIHVNTLGACECVDVKLFLQDSETQKLSVYRNGASRLESGERQWLMEQGDGMLYVARSDYRGFQHLLRKSLASLLKDDSASVDLRLATLSEVARDAIAAAFSSGDVEQVIKQGRALVHQCAVLLSQGEYLPAELIAALHHDDSPHTHATNTAFLCILLAKEFGITRLGDLRQIGLGGLLHDLGKRDVSTHVLTRPESPTPGDYDQIKRHTHGVYHQLCHRSDITYGQLMMVYQHHERFEGGGYPVGCPAVDVHPWARICTVIDAFDSLISDRPYRQRMSLSNAGDIMKRAREIIFDPEILECWLTTIKHS
ncbi:MAG: hypothetical protein MPJ50_12595 [Pirellulales bacterium]|nr:hypothetical protein [Pirellulales bacterium]